MILKVVLPAKFIYQYAVFVPGKVYVEDGKIGPAAMNYNRLLDQVLCINQHGDKLGFPHKSTG